MFLKRIGAHFAAQNWPAVAIELLIVVVGVFLGLQAQDWNQRRLDRITEQANLDRLAADFTGIEKDLGRCLSVYRGSVAAIREVREATALDSAPGSANREELSGALIRMTAGDIPAGRSATFVEMLSTGDLGLLRDTKLRDALVAYDERAQVNREIWRSLREEMSSYMQPLYEHVSLQIDLDGDAVSSITVPDILALASDVRFRAMLNALAGAKSNVYELCRYQFELTARIQDSLAAPRAD